MYHWDEPLVSDSEPVQNPASSPTLTMRATMAGMIMGTATYMAPEQARGQNLDRVSISHTTPRTKSELMNVR